MSLEVLKNIKMVVRRKFEDCKVGVSFVITEHNYHEIEAAASLYKEIGVDSIRYTFTYDPEGEGAMSAQQAREAERSIPDWLTVSPSSTYQYA